MKKILILLFIISSKIAYAEHIGNGFSVIDQHLDFDKTIRSGKCHGTVPHPILVGEDEELFMKINDEIHDFIELHSICNSQDESNFVVSYNVPPSGNKDFFSILWLVQKDDELWRIDALNFNAHNGDIISDSSIFNDHSKSLDSLIKLSQGMLSDHCTWEQFLDKIEKRDIQLYLKDNEWYICFNSYGSFNKVLEVKIPQYFFDKKR